jgi:ribonuclease E
VPAIPVKQEPGLLAKIIKAIAGLFDSTKPEEPAPAKRPHHKHQHSDNRRHHRRDRKDARDARNRDKITDNLSRSKPEPKDAEAKEQRPERESNGNRNDRDGNSGRNDRDGSGNRNDRGRNRRNRRRSEGGDSGTGDGAREAQTQPVANTVETEAVPPRRPNQRRGRNNERQRGPKLEVGEGLDQQPTQEVAAEERSGTTTDAAAESPRPPRRERVAPAVAMAAQTEDSLEPAVVNQEVTGADTESRQVQVEAENAVTPQATSTSALAAGTDASEPASAADEPSAVTSPAPTSLTSDANSAVGTPPDLVKSYVRPANDPRANPKPVTHTEVANVLHSVSRTRPLDTSLPVSIERNPRPLARPANDPRVMGGGSHRADAEAFAG